MSFVSILNHICYNFLVIFMEYSIVEGKILNSNNYECQRYRYVKVRESPNSIFLKCALFRTHSCESFGKIDKITDLFEVTNLHNHSVESHNKEKIILCNQIKRKGETTTSELRETFNECCRDSIGASSVTFKKLESSMFKRRRKIQPRLPSCAQEFGVLLLESGYCTNHLKTVIQEDDVALIFGSDSMVNKLPDLLIFSLMAPSKSSLEYSYNSSQYLLNIVVTPFQYYTS